MILAVGNDGQFARFCESAECAGLAADPRFATNKARVENRSVLIPLLKQRTVLRTTADWIARLEQCGVPCGPINTLADVFADPQVRARGLKVDMRHSQAGTVSLVASPIRLSDTPVDYRRPPPLLGEHTGEVLREVLRLDELALAGLKEKGVI
jgi:crotonobetainyl-CoA:carnitine CoA-transferase CaiB-like acyl-CoA transferase